MRPFRSLFRRTLGNRLEAVKHPRRKQKCSIVTTQLAITRPTPAYHKVRISGEIGDWELDRDAFELFGSWVHDVEFPPDLLLNPICWISNSQDLSHARVCKVGDNLANRGKNFPFWSPLPTKFDVRGAPFLLHTVTRSMDLPSHTNVYDLLVSYIE